MFFKADVEKLRAYALSEGLEVSEEGRTTFISNPLGYLDYRAVWGYSETPWEEKIEAMAQRFKRAVARKKERELFLSQWREEAKKILEKLSYEELKFFAGERFELIKLINSIVDNKGE